MTLIFDELKSLLLPKEAILIMGPEQTAIPPYKRDSRLDVKLTGAAVHTKPLR